MAHLLSEEERAARRTSATEYMLVEGGKAAAVATVGVTLFHFAAEKLSAAYRSKPLSAGKLFALSSVVVAAFVIKGEHALLERSAEDRERDAVLLEAYDRAKQIGKPVQVEALRAAAGNSSAAPEGQPKERMA